MPKIEDSSLETLRDTLRETPVQSAVAVNTLIELVGLMAAADGNVTDGECEQIAGILRRLALMSLDAASVRIHVSQAMVRLERDGLARRLEHARSEIVHPEERMSVFRSVAAVALVDGWLDRGEIRFFNDLARAFEIAPADASAMVTSMRAQLFPPGNTPPDGTATP